MPRYHIEPAEHPLDFCWPDPSTNPVKPMEVFLEFDPQEGSLLVDTRHAIDGTPMQVWHGVIRRYPIPALANAVELTRGINAGELDRLLDIIAVGHSVDWDGHNWVGRLTRAAEDAEFDLATKLGEHYEDFGIGGLCDATAWIGDTWGELGITVETTSAELKALAERLEAEALFEQNARLYRTTEALEYYQQALINAQESSEE